MRCIPKVLPKFQAKAGSKTTHSGFVDAWPKPFRFRFSESSPDPSQFKIVYTDPSKKWWLDGVEYASAEKANVTPDDGSIEHVIEIENAEISAILFYDGILAAVSDLDAWRFVDITVYNSRFTGCLDSKARQSLVRRFFIGGPELIGNIEFWAAGLNSIRISGAPVGLVGDIGKTKFTLTSWCYFRGCSITGDLSEANWAPSSYVYLDWTLISSCSQPLIGWSSTRLYFSNCPLDTQAVDNILVGLDQEGQSDGVLRIDNTSVPSQTGLDAISNLEAKGWTITYDS